MGVEESTIVKGVLEGLRSGTRDGYITTLERFVNEFARDITVKQLVEEAKSDVRKTQQRIDIFFHWLQDEKGISHNSARIYAYGYLRGFFSNLDIHFERKWRRNNPKPTTNHAIKMDKAYTFFYVDERTRTIRFDRERMQKFLSNLKPRDVAITLALLSSSQDTSDLCKLNVGDFKQQDSPRFFWEGNRNKTGILFKTFFSKEATRLVRRYLEQERLGADDSEPLFTYATRRRGQKEPTEERMAPHILGQLYRDVARKMGIRWENGEQNPLRPKRMRHLFRTACDTAGITELCINAYMGHKNNQGQDYSELSQAKLELEYLRVEPFLTVYGELEESLEIKQDISKLESRILDLNRKIEEQKQTIDVLHNNLEKIARDAVKRYIHEEIASSDRDLQKWREEFLSSSPTTSSQESDSV